MGQWLHFDKSGVTSVAGYAWGEIPAGKPSIESGTAQGGGASTITLAANESPVDDAYTGLRIALLTGPGSTDHRTITGYVGLTKVATVDSPWSATPTTSTTYRIFKAVKFAVQNLGPRALVAQVLIEQKDDSDGNEMALTALDTGTLSPPHTVSAAVSAGGGSWGATGTYYYRLTATTATGETVGSIEVSATVTVVTQTVVLTFTPPATATAIKVYRTATSGTYTAALRATLGGGAVTYSDTGAATAAGDLPSANTSGGISPDYGTPPATLGTTALTLGTVAVGEVRHYWVNVFVPDGTPEEGNDRSFYITLAEV